jgi:hypothetical protein
MGGLGSNLNIQDMTMRMFDWDEEKVVTGRVRNHSESEMLSLILNRLWERAGRLLNGPGITFRITPLRIMRARHNDHSAKSYQSVMSDSFSSSWIISLP